LRTWLHYIKALRTVQEGPYFLGGWSFGGLVAFEMAQQLLSSGYQWLYCCVDTLAPVSTNKPSFWEGCKFLITTVGRYMAFSPGLFVSGDCPTSTTVFKGKRLRDHFTVFLN